jgi:hypothetical protein
MSFHTDSQSTQSSDFEYVEEFDDNFNPIIPPYTNRGGTNFTPLESTLPIITPPTRDIPCIIDYLSFTFSLSSLASSRTTPIVNIKGKRYQHSLLTPLNADEAFFKEHMGDEYEGDSFFLFNPKNSIDEEATNFLTELTFYIPHLTFHDSTHGKFGYKKSFNLYRDGEQQSGVACYDGNKDTMLVSLSGRGTSGVDMVRLHNLIKNLPQIKITRVDIAHDDLEGEIPLSKFINYYDEGQFTIRGSAPSCRLIDDRGSGDGCTFYVGNKANGKEACIYEKGKQLGDSKSPWVRSEVRLTSVDRIIPLDVLTSSAMYMAGAYPVFARLCAFCERIAVIKKQATITFDSLIKYASTAYGGLINVMSSIGLSDTEIVLRLRTDKTPKRLILPLPPEQVAA